jgi:hypothetical protein
MKSAANSPARNWGQTTVSAGSESRFFGAMKTWSVLDCPGAVVFFSARAGAGVVVLVAAAVVWLIIVWFASW